MTDLDLMRRALERARAEIEPLPVNEARLQALVLIDRALGEVPRLTDDGWVTGVRT